MYWLFKKYMARLVADYRIWYEDENAKTHNTAMRPDFYWLEQYLSAPKKQAGK